MKNSLLAIALASVVCLSLNADTIENVQEEVVTIVADVEAEIKKPCTSCDDCEKDCEKDVVVSSEESAN